MNHNSQVPTRSGLHVARTLGVAAFLVTTVLLAMTASRGATAPAALGANPTVVTDWNTTAVATIVTDAGKNNAEAFLWYAFEQAAVYNAVVGITGRYELYQWDVYGPVGASPEAAAAAAAHRVLLTYFPASEARLDAAYAKSLSQLPDDDATRDGIRYGEQAADNIIDLRMDDRRSASINLTTQLTPGAWRPATTAPAAAFFDPWLSQMEPLVLRSASQFRPVPPTPLTSPIYTDEFNEVKVLGSATSTLRTPAQTETALFVSGIPIVSFQAALRELATRRGMDISDSARIFAAVDLSIADAIGAVWDSKVEFNFWRPITAIRLADEDGNPETIADATWTPLIATPPYPDYASGLSGVAGALTRSLTRVLGTNRIDLNVFSPVTNTTRNYQFAADLNQDVIDARVWSGIHFRTADVVGAALGTQVADWALDHYFQPTN